MARAFPSCDLCGLSLHGLTGRGNVGFIEGFISSSIYKRSEAILGFLSFSLFFSEIPEMSGLTVPALDSPETIHGGLRKPRIQKAKLL